MVSICIALGMILNTLFAPRQIGVQFLHSMNGRMVTIMLDGQTVEQTFAGKMGFRDESHSWQSVCADVRSPVSEGQVFPVRVIRSSAASPNVRMAGNIVAKYFNAAQTPDQCAGLQIAVWKAIEDGTPTADFSSGRFQVRADAAAMMYAAAYYQAVSEDGDALYLQTQGSGGDGGGGQSASGGQGGGGQSQMSGS